MAGLILDIGCCGHIKRVNWTYLKILNNLTRLKVGYNKTRRYKIVSWAIATSVDHLPCAAASFNFTGQLLRLPGECGPYDFGPVSAKR